MGFFDYLHPKELFSPKEMIDDTKFIKKWWDRLKGFGDKGRGRRRKRRLPPRDKKGRFRRRRRKKK